jgi:hypothetical protein
MNRLSWEEMITSRYEWARDAMLRDPALAISDLASLRDTAMRLADMLARANKRLAQLEQENRELKARAEVVDILAEVAQEVRDGQF